jgi:hypothetical protein
MKLRKSPIALAALALAGSFPLASKAAPSVSFRTPSSGQTLSGNLYQSSACEVAGSNLRRVEFFLGSTRLNTEYGAPWNCNLDTRKFADGRHILKAVAYDASNATATAQIAVDIRNNASNNTSNGTSNTAPSVSLKAPANGATVSGSISGSACEALSIDDRGVKQVQFYLGSTLLNTELSSPWNCALDTRKFADGSHTLKAVATDAAGATGAAQISLNIKNGTGSSSSGSGPAVSFRTPASGATLSGAIAQSPACEVTGSGIRKVQFFLGSTALNTEGSAPWNCDIDTRKFADGSHTLKALAYDASGASSTAQVGITIRNGASAPGTGTGAAVSAADILVQASGDAPFAEQKGYSGQVIGTYPPAASIPERGIHGTRLSNGETLRLGKETDPAGSGRKALAFQLAPNDPTTSGSRRSELKFADNIEHNKVYWVAFRMYVRDWGTLSSSDAAVFGTQLHSGDNSRGLSPSFSLVTYGGRTFQIYALHSTSSSPAHRNSVTVKSGPIPVPFGRWVDMVFKFKQNTAGNGFLQAWIDGKQVVDYRGSFGFNTPGYKDYMKFGYYNWSSFSSPRKVLLRAPTLVLDPTGSRYRAEDLRAYVNK